MCPMLVCLLLCKYYINFYLKHQRGYVLHIFQNISDILIINYPICKYTSLNLANPLLLLRFLFETLIVTSALLTYNIHKIERDIYSLYLNRLFVTWIRHPIGRIYFILFICFVLFLCLFVFLHKVNQNY